MIKNLRKANKGITLIALVITIIVLLILAAVSIATLTGENGILKKATKAERESEKTTIEEKIKLAIIAATNENGINLEVLEKELVNNIGLTEGEIVKEGENGSLPWRVNSKGYSFIINENGKIEPAGHEPTIDVSSLKITLKDGGEIPTDGVDKGTELKITFIASIENGTITNVTLGTVQNGQITYTTTGTEKEVTFKITGKVGNDSYETTYKVVLEEYYKKTEFEAGDIKNAPNTFYGAEVTGYTYPSDGVSKWRIFYADSSNIYLIADDYIDSTKAPKGQGGSSIYKNSDYALSFNNVYNDYSGSEWILGTHTDKDGKVVENSLAKKWLTKYFNYTPDEGLTYPNRTSTNKNIRAVAYMMDTNVWGMYKGEKAEYAIGGVPIEMYCESYKQTHPTSNISCGVTGTNGYAYSNTSGLSSDCDKIYIKPDNSKSSAMWLASPFDYAAENLVGVFYDGLITYGYGYNNSFPGLRPLVCLKSEVQLKKTGDREYTIQ